MYLSGLDGSTHIPTPLHIRERDFTALVKERKKFPDYRNNFIYFKNSNIIHKYIACVRTFTMFHLCVLICLFLSEIDFRSNNRNLQSTFFIVLFVHVCTWFFLFLLPVILRTAPLNLMCLKCQNLPHHFSFPSCLSFVEMGCFIGLN